MAIKYGVCPGEVKSKNDGQYHYIGPHRLMKLYCVPPYECVILSRREDWLFLDTRGLTLLFPRENGDYPLFRKEKKHVQEAENPANPRG